MPVIVANTDGAIAVLDGAYTYLPVATGAPTITVVQPATGPAIGGTTLTDSREPVHRPGDGDRRRRGGDAGAVPEQLGARRHDVALAGWSEPAVGHRPGTAPGDRPFEFRTLQAAVTRLHRRRSGRRRHRRRLGGAVRPVGRPMPATARTTGTTTAAPTPRNAWIGRIPAASTRGISPRARPGSFFSTRVALANPGVMPAHVLFRFLTAGRRDRAARPRRAGGRAPHDRPGAARRGCESANISTVIESDAEVVVDRTMRWDQDPRGGAHAESSLPAPSLRWYLAEGATHGSFDLFYLLQNPSLTQTAQLRRSATCCRPARRSTRLLTSRRTAALDRLRRSAARAGGHRRLGGAHSLNGVPIIVERAMYSSAAGIFAAGHDSAGVTSPSTRLVLRRGRDRAASSTRSCCSPTRTPPPATCRRPTCCRRARRCGRTTSGAGQQPPHPLRRSSRIRRWPTPRCRSRLHVDQRRRLHRRAVDVVAARPGLVRGPQLRRRDRRPGRSGRRPTARVGRAPRTRATFLLIANTSPFAGTVRVTLLFETGRRRSRRNSPSAGQRRSTCRCCRPTPASAAYMRVPRGHAVQRGGREPRRDAARRSSSSVRCTGTPPADLGRGIEHPRDAIAVATSGGWAGLAAEPLTRCGRRTASPCRRRAGNTRGRRRRPRPRRSSDSASGSRPLAS